MNGVVLGSFVRKCPNVFEIAGTSNEFIVFINGTETKALLDTGSCVSTCSKSFYENNLSFITYAS